MRGIKHRLQFALRDVLQSDPAVETAGDYFSSRRALMATRKNFGCRSRRTARPKDVLVPVSGRPLPEK